MRASARMENGDSHFVIDWSELKEIISDFVFHGKHSLKQSSALYELTKHTELQHGERWYGYSVSELKSWLEKGFRTDNLGIDVTPPIREKRRYVYSEEADEMHIDRVLSGEDNYAGEFTKRVIIPGVKIKVETGFQSSTKAEVVNAFNVFVCQCIQSLEASGVDCEITMEYAARRLINGVNIAHTEVRIKKENEASDFGTYSAMISPGSFRTFIFIADALHAESLGRAIISGQGIGVNYQNGGKWDVTRNEKTQEITFHCPWHPGSFPKSEMTAKFRQVLGLIDY